MAEVGEKKDPTERIAAALERIADSLETVTNSGENLGSGIVVSVRELWDATAEGGGKEGDESALRVYVVATPESP